MSRMNTAVLGLVLAFATPAFADEFTPAFEAYLASDIVVWASDPALLDAIRAQNAAMAGHDQAAIDALDAQWQAEVSAADSALIGGVLHNPAADFLRARVEASGGKITEAFITDAKGLNVAASEATSDYWQGDEDKFQKVFPNAGAHFISGIELDESTQRYQGQISLTIADPATGEALGTLTVGIDADSLM